MCPSETTDRASEREKKHSKILILPAEKWIREGCAGIWIVHRMHVDVTERKRKEEILQLGRELISIYLIAFHNYIIRRPLIVRLFVYVSFCCSFQFYKEFLSRAKVLCFVMSYVRLLLRKYHFLLQVGVPDELKDDLSSKLLVASSRTWERLK